MRLSNALLVRSFPSFLLLPFSSLLFLLPLRFRCCVRLRVLASIRLSQWRLPTTRVEFSRMPRDIWRIHLAASTRNNEARRGTRTKNLFITLPFPRFLPPLLPVGFPALPNPPQDPSLPPRFSPFNMASNRGRGRIPVSIQVEKTFHAHHPRCYRRYYHQSVL